MADRFTIFAGAGASKAVNAREFPTTVEFFDRLPTSISSDSLFQLARAYIQEVQRPEQIDIEMILWALETMQSDCQSLQSADSVTGRLFSNRMIKELTPGNNLGAFTAFTSNASSRLARLISKINEVVYDLYGYEPSEKELRGNWLELLDHAEGAGDSLEIFTTNYDAVIETALDIRLGSETAKDWRGISGRLRQKLNLKRWADIGAHDATLTKLHGSLDWRYAGTEIHVGDPNFTGDHLKHAIIYPGFKGQNSSEFFSVFHNYLARAISESHTILFIGFAFRDEYINSIIRENCRDSARVFIINPEIVNFPSRRGKLSHIRSGFNSAAISSLKI